MKRLPDIPFNVLTHPLTPMEQNTDLNISPTPWSVERVTYDPGLTCVVRAANGTVVHWRKPGRDDSEYMRDQQNAEAQLIAAAPDGIAFAQAFLDFMVGSDTDDIDFGRGLASSGLVEQAKAYVSKATGSDH